MVQIIRNVGGVPGLHVALNVFSEETERRLFELPVHYPATKESTTRCGKSMHPSTWPVDIFRVCNAVEDCGLVPEYIRPDYCLSLNYPPGVGFQVSCICTQGLYIFDRKI